MRRVQIVCTLLATAFLVGCPSPEDPPLCFEIVNSDGTSGGIVTIQPSGAYSTSGGDQGTLTPILGGYRFNSSVGGGSGNAHGPFGSDGHYTWENSETGDSGKLKPVPC